MNDIPGNIVSHRTVTAHTTADTTIGRALADAPEWVSSYFDATPDVPEGHMVQLHVIVAVQPVAPPEPQAEPEKPTKALGRRIRV